MSRTIHILSKKSDLHLEIAQARDDLTGEKLSSRHMSDEVENYRALLQEAHDKLAQQRRECAELRSSLAACDVVKSICFIPGLTPSSLIELFSGRIMWLQRALRKRESDVMLPISSLKKKPKSPTKGSGLSGDERDAPHEPPLCSGESAADMYADICRQVQTPDKLLEVLDVAIMSRRLSEQEERLEEMQAHNQDLRARLREQEMKDCGDIVPETYAVEQALISKMAAEKELALCQHSLSLTKFELTRSKKRATQCEMDLLDCQEELERVRAASYICSKCSGKFSLTGDDEEEETEEGSGDGCPHCKKDHRCRQDSAACLKSVDLAHRLRERTVQVGGSRMPSHPYIGFV
jgi:DNA-directed RNA polymerase subunit RPC12/RpoP